MLKAIWPIFLSKVLTAVLVPLWCESIGTALALSCVCRLLTFKLWEGEKMNKKQKKNLLVGLTGFCVFVWVAAFAVLFYTDSLIADFKGNALKTPRDAAALTTMSEEHRSLGGKRL